MKFKYNNPVIVISGFYEGLKGRVKECLSGYVEEKYSVDLCDVSGLKNLGESELKLDERVMQLRENNRRSLLK